MTRRVFLAVSVAFVMSTGCSSMEVGGGSSPITGAAGETGNGNSATPQLVRCQEPVGTIALVESQIAGLGQAGLSSPVPLIRLIASQSRCFNVVDRGGALDRMLQERQLGGMLQPGSNVGSGQMVAADYLITPNVVFSQSDAGGVAGLLGGLSFIPYAGAALALAGSVASNIRFAEAQAIMTVTDTRSGVQTAVAEGRAKATDLGGGLGLASIQGLGGL